MNTGNTVQGGLLGNMQPTRTYGSLSYNPVNPSATPMATSVSTGQPTGGSITPLISSVNPQITHPTVTAPVTKQVSTDVNGNKTETHYQAPPPPPLGSPGNPQTGYHPDSLMAKIIAAPTQDPNVNPNAAPGTTGSAAPGTAPTTFGGLLSGAMGQAQTYEQAQAAQAQQAQDVISKYAGLEGGLANTPESGAIGSARLAQLEALKTGALGEISGEQAKLAGYQTPITSLYGTEIGATQPSANFPFVFNPATGTYTTPGAGGTGTPGTTTGTPTLTYNPQTDIASAVSAIQANPSSYNSYKDAISSGYGSNGSTIAAQLDASLLKAGLNPTDLAAKSTASATSIGTAGTAAANTWNGIYSSAQTQAANFSQQQSAINGIGNQVINTMQSLGINPSDSQFANKTINQVATQFSSPAYAQFNTQIQSLQARIGQALQAGEIPTAATGNAAAIANGSLSFPALLSTLQAVDKEMGTFVQTQQSLADYAKGQLGTTGGSTTGTSGGTSGGTGAFSDSSFYGTK